MPQFAPDQVTFQDGPGMGAWDDSHYREHLQFVQVLAGKTPPVLLPDYDFIQMLTAGSSRNSIWEKSFRSTPATAPNDRSRGCGLLAI